MSASEGVRHATVMALNKIHPWIDGQHYSYRACDWVRDSAVDSFNSIDAANVLDGHRPTWDLPTCPACAALLDLALEMRGAS